MPEIETKTESKDEEDKKQNTVPGGSWDDFYLQ